ncbi:MAG: hypothetical protein IKI21_04305 [Oscillospiraceae bacterium]|nr:hypothetical protein [Oscillospiraceae bacterium]
MTINDTEKYDRFVDAVKLCLIRWRDGGIRDFAVIAKKLGISERTARRRFNTPGTLTLDELYAWCELYGKDPAAVLLQAFAEAGRDRQ